MKELLVAIFALLALGAQPPSGSTCGPDDGTRTYRQRCPDGPDANFDQRETVIPPGDYCKAKGVRILPSETRAHECDCKMACDPNGEPIEAEGCLSWCHKNRRACTCHPEDPCPGSHPAAAGLVDMDGNVVAITRRH